MAYRVVLAGGGTAGHIEPALAVADAIGKLNPAVECSFIGTENGLENLLIPKAGYLLHKIPKVTLPRKISIKTLLFPVRIVSAVAQARSALRGVDLVIGFGGYVSAATYIAAKLSKIPIVIHEANAKPGWANRLARNWAGCIAVTFEEISWPGAILTGIPLRESIVAINSMSPKELTSFRALNCESWGFDPQLPVIAIFGGSQGSHHINSVIAEFLETGDWRGKVQLIHAVGVNNPIPPTQPGYLPVAYLHDMAAVYGSADVMITRSGAVTCAEIATVGGYAILVPLPHGNGEQITNAESLVRQGRAIAVFDGDFDADWLKSKLPEALLAARSLGRMPSAIHLGAAKRIAELALNLVEQR